MRQRPDHLIADDGGRQQRVEDGCRRTDGERRRIDQPQPVIAEGREIDEDLAGKSEERAGREIRPLGQREAQRIAEGQHGIECRDAARHSAFAGGNRRSGLSLSMAKL